LQRFLQLKIRSKKNIKLTIRSSTPTPRLDTQTWKTQKLDFIHILPTFILKTTTFYVSSRSLEENIFVSFSNILISLIDQTSLRVLAHRVVIANELTFKYQCPPVTSLFVCRQNANSSIGKTITLEFKRHRNSIFQNLQHLAIESTPCK